MSEAFDLDAYLQRVGHEGSARPDLETLTALHARQVDAIPFESLDPLLGRPVRLDLPSLQAKLLGERRGGYCFELNALFQAALEAIGFQVTGLGARVRWMSPPDAPLGPRSHMLLKLALPDGPYLADVGFGANLLDAPLKFEVGLEQSTPAGRYRLDREGEHFALRVRRGEDWRTAYFFDLTPQLPADYAVSNWFTATHPESLFVSNLVAERLTAEARWNLINNRLVETRRDGRQSEQALSAAAELGEALADVFGLAAPAPAETLWAKIEARAAPTAASPGSPSPSLLTATR